MQYVSMLFVHYILIAIQALMLLAGAACCLFSACGFFLLITEECKKIDSLEASKRIQPTVMMAILAFTIAIALKVYFPQ